MVVRTINNNLSLSLSVFHVHNHHFCIFSYCAPIYFSFAIEFRMHEITRQNVLNVVNRLLDLVHHWNWIKFQFWSDFICFFQFGHIFLSHGCLFCLLCHGTTSLVCRHTMQREADRLQNVYLLFIRFTSSRVLKKLITQMKCIGYAIVYHCYRSLDNNESDGIWFNGLCNFLYHAWPYKNDFLYLFI